MRFNKKYLMEFLGTAIFMFVVCGFAMFIGAENHDFYKKAFNIYAYTGAFLIAFVAAVTYILLYMFFSKVTLCHFNPVFTFAYLADGRIKGKEFVLYVISQIMGAISGLGLIVKIKEYMTMPDATRTVVGEKKVYDSMGNEKNVALLVGNFKAKLTNLQGRDGIPSPEAFAFILEVVLTLILVWVVLKTTSDKNTRRLRGVFIGISIGLVYWLGIAYTATMLNPAKEIASIVINASLKWKLLLDELFIFIIGPMAGAGIAVGIYKEYEILEKCEQLIGAIIFVVLSSAILWSLIPMYTFDVSLDMNKYESYVMMRDTAIVNLLAPIGIAVSFLIAHFISGSKRITMFNPLVSLAQYVSKQIDARQCVSDIVLQSVGMLLGFVPLTWVEKEVLRRSELSCSNSISHFGNIGPIVAIILVLILYAILIGMALHLNRKIHIFSMFMMAGIMIPINVIAIRFIGVIDNPIRSILIATISKEFKDTMILVGIMLAIALVVGILHNKMLKLFKKSYVREMLGTYILVLFSVGAAMSIGLQMTKKMGIEYMLAIVATVIIIGLTYIILYYSFELKAQFNPVISMAQWFNGMYSLKETLANICMQIVGAVGAFATLVGIYKLSGRIDGTLVKYAMDKAYPTVKNEMFGYFSIVLDVDAYSEIDRSHLQVFLVEMIVTMIIFVVTANVLKKKKRNMFAGVIMGISLSVTSLFGIVYSNSIGNITKDIASLIFNLIDGNDKVLATTGIAFVGMLYGILLGMLVHKISLKYFREFIGMFVYIILAFGVSMNFMVYLYIHTFYYPASGVTSYSHIRNAFNCIVIVMAFGLAYVIIYYAFGKENKAHFNPLITIALWVNKKVKTVSALLHILFQMLGAIAGAAFIYWLHMLVAGRFDYSGYQSLCECWDPISERVCGVAANVVYTRGVGTPEIKEVLVALLIEVIFTFIVVLTTLYVNDKKYRFLGASGIITAKVLMISCLMAMPFTGGSFNPIRSLASAIINAKLGFERPMQQVWIFIIAPLIGAVLAILIYKLFNKEKNKIQSV